MATQVSVFQCPRCKEYIASDAQSCRFCSTPIDPETVRRSVTAQEQENRKFRRGHYRKHLLIGAGLFALGAALTLGSFYAALGGRFLVTYGLLLAGAGEVLYGLFGWLGELRSR